MFTKSIRPLGFGNQAVQAQQASVGGHDAKDGYEDPLMKWPVRGLAYSNELGVAINEIAPKLGTALWIPALMYFGADIYDKYKNDQTAYDPSKRRGAEQATFQALASVILPTFAVHLGQKVISLFNFGKSSGLSIQAREEHLRCLQHSILHNKLKDFQDRTDEYKKIFDTDLNLYVSEKSGIHRSKNAVKRFWEWLFQNKHPEAMAQYSEEKLKAVSSADIDEIFDIRKQFMEGKKPPQVSDKLFGKFESILEKFKGEYGDEALAKAAKYAVNEHLNSKIFKIKLWKTLGGFVSLGLLIKPIDMFVEEVVMEKYVKPSLEKFKRVGVSKPE